MTIHQLKVFDAVARNRNISRASKELHVSQPTVSRHLKELEAEVGYRLYRIAKGGIRLTIDGEVFRREVKALLAEFDRVQDTFKKKKTSNIEQLRIGTTLGAKMSFVASMVGAFLKDYRQARAAIVEGFSPDLERKVLNFELDAAVVNHLGRFDGLRYENVGRKIDMVPFVSSRHPLARKNNLTSADVLGAPLILRMREHGTDSRMERTLRRLAPPNVDLNVVLYTGSHHALILAVKQLLGVGFTHRDRLKSGVRSKKYKILDLPGLSLTADTYFVSAKSKPLSPLAAKFKEFMLSRLGRNRKALRDG